ncbi:MAG: hypothetical protein KA963_02475, partial [Candidatus Cloacimonas sp.]|nr:hypothetical protein [Candidatus Cloacimonas sp.]
MNYRNFLSLCILVLITIFLFSINSAEENSAEENAREFLSEEEYPSDMDTLEEFIQSYYLLLESNEYL